MESILKCSFCGTSNATYKSDRYGNIMYDRKGNPMMEKDKQTRSYYRCTMCGNILCGNCMKSLGTRRKDTHVFKSAEYWNACPDCGGKMAEIASATSSGSDCFITSATLNSLNITDDNCHELSTFRAFRDTWMKDNHPEDIVKYYQVAPKIVSGINSSKYSSEVYNDIWMNRLKPCLEMIEKGENENAYEAYKQMVEELMVFSN